MSYTGCQEKIDLTINPIQDGGVGRGGQTPHPLPVFFLLQLLQTLELAPKTF